jgi:hypothetical protein
MQRFLRELKKTCGRPDIYLPTACGGVSAADEVVDTTDRSDAEHDDAANNAGKSGE